MGAVVAKVAVEDIVLPTLSQKYLAPSIIYLLVYILFVIYSVFISLFSISSIFQ